jgi:uncharacterized membrane-anchored protein
LSVLFFSVQMLDRIAPLGAPASATSDQPSGLPLTNGWYWTGMLIAGTLGTALGDGLADAVGLGVGPASVILGLVLAAVFGIRAQSAFATKASYWLTIVTVRTTGTTVGDVLAHSFGLELSTVCTGLLLAFTLVVWKEQPQAIVRQA